MLNYSYINVIIIYIKKFKGVDTLDPSVAIQIVALVVLIALSSFFSSAETSFVSVNLIRMRSLADDGNKRAARVLKIRENSAKMLSAVLIGNNLVNISASALATMVAQSLFGNSAVSIATGIMTVVVLIFGEITPKTSQPPMRIKLRRYTAA